MHDGDGHEQWKPLFDERTLLRLVWSAPRDAPMRRAQVSGDDTTIINNGIIEAIDACRRVRFSRPTKHCDAARAGKLRQHADYRQQRRGRDD